MLTMNRWQSAPALVITLSIASSTIAPLVFPAVGTAKPAPIQIAQLFPSPNTPSRLAIPAGVQIPVSYYSSDKIVVLPTETVPLTLTVARNIRSSSGALLIPAGSEVVGKLRPARGGSQFVAEYLVIDGRRTNLSATSEVVTTTQEVRPGTNTSSILTGAAIGAAAAAVISGVTGSRRITFGKVIAGAGAGALGGLLLGRKKADVIVINPDRDLTLTLNRTLALR
jgi:hypothetical protein